VRRAQKGALSRGGSCYAVHEELVFEGPKSTRMRRPLRFAALQFDLNLNLCLGVISTVHVGFFWKGGYALVRLILVTI
jgi:hypothetical protein